MKNLLFLVLLIIPLSAQPIPGWDLVWSDEFDQANGSLPDSTKWGYDVGGHGWGNQELQYYTANRTENARIENGELIIEVREEPFGGRDYTSARLLTKNKWDWKYGRFEARVKSPYGSGLWPAVWMLGTDIDTVSWPQCGEIDIMEHVARLPKEIFGTIHGPGYSGGDSLGDIHTFVDDVALDYHTFVVEWDENSIRWFVDDIHYFTAKPADVSPNQWVFDHNFFMILNMAVGGNFGGTLDPNLNFPRQMLVDYVRVYTPGSQGGVNQLQNPGFENGNLAPWIGYSADGANENGGYIESPSNTYFNGGNPGGDNVLTYSGIYVSKVFGDFNGNENYNGFYQDLSVTPGTTWQGSGKALTHVQDLFSGTNTAWIEVTFKNATGDSLALYRSENLTSANVTPGTWMDLEITREFDPVSFNQTGTVTEMVAPAGAVTMRYQVVFRQPLYDGGSIYLDDLFLSQPVVETPFTHSTEVGQLVTWTATQSTSSYQPQFSNDQNSWTNLGSAIVGNVVQERFDPIGYSFYRVVETPTSGGTQNLAANATSGFELSWETENGFTYQVESSSGLDNFSDVGSTIVGDGNPATYRAEASATRLFYRIRKDQP